MSYTPARKAHIRKLLERELYNDPNFSCTCSPVEIFTQSKQGYTDSTITNNMRVAQIISSSLGGRITFGNFGESAQLTYLGGIEGQPGGLPRPLRNRF
jgi:hypothetical protein